jgi:hypothetical protein
VCWNSSYSAMRRLSEAEYPSDLRAALIEPDSNYRWSWREKAVFRIEDHQAYKQRMNFYWDLVEDFYAGAPILEPINRNRGYQLFELSNRKIVVAAFDSIVLATLAPYSEVQ